MTKKQLEFREMGSLSQVLNDIEIVEFFFFLSFLEKEEERRERLDKNAMEEGEEKNLCRHKVFRIACGLTRGERRRRRRREGTER